jgi:hypothetical protein
MSLQYNYCRAKYIGRQTQMRGTAQEPEALWRSNVTAIYCSPVVLQASNHLESDLYRAQLPPAFSDLGPPATPGLTPPSDSGIGGRWRCTLLEVAITIGAQY